MTVEKPAFSSQAPGGWYRLFLCLVLLFGSLLPASQAKAAAALDIGPATIINSGAADGAAVWGDIDNDGDQDLLLTGRGQGEMMTTLLLGNSDGSLTSVGSAGLPRVEASSLALADFDLDGDLDVLITGQRGVNLAGELGLARIYQNDGSGTFTLHQELTGIYRGSADWGDYDNDGDPDVLMAGYQDGGSGFGAIYRNDEGLFVLNDSLSVPGVGDSTVKWGDYDADGNLDFVIIGRRGETSATRVAEVFHNDGGGLFTSLVMTVNGLWSGSAAWLDIDGDGDQDLILTGNNGPDSFNRDPVTYVYNFDPAAGFTLVEVGLPGAWQTSLSVGDYDNDGDPDLLMNGLTTLFNFTRIYINNSGFFSGSGIELQSGTGATVAWGHLDDDDSLDAAVTGVEGPASTRSTYVYPNLPAVANTAPSAPGLVSACWDTESSVILNWTGAADQQTPASALTYNLRAGSAPGLRDIISPPSAADGYHRLAGQGAYTSDTLAILKGLADGQYTWSVQAVDSAFTGSPFSPEGNFAVGIFVAEYDQAWIGGSQPVLIDVLENDNDNYDDLVIQSVQSPIHGSAAIQDNQILFTPQPDWAGIEQFDYYALSPSTGHCSRASISVMTEGLFLHPTWVKEGKPVGTIVGAFTATSDETKPGETFTYKLVSGAGGEDNASFAIDRNKLITAAVFDAHVKNLYHVRIRAIGSMGAVLTRSFTITVLPVSLNPPTDIMLSNSAIQENVNGNTTVGVFSCIDPDEEGPCAFRLRDGPGGEDNHLFSISGSSLISQAVFDYEVRSSYSIRVRAYDRSGLTLDKVFTISIVNVSDSAPSGVLLSAETIQEMMPVGSLVGSFSTIDSDPSDTFRYRLVAGDGSDDNAAFRIEGNLLLSAIVFDFEERSSYAIRVRSTDQTDRFTEQAFVISISDAQEFYNFYPLILDDGLVDIYEEP